MTAAISANLKVQQKNIESFLEKHSISIAFAVSILALLILSPLHFFLGTAIGLAVNYFINTPQKTVGNIVTLPNALFTIIGATAALLTLTPAGAGGGFVFKAIPFVASLTIGSTAYRAIKSF